MALTRPAEAWERDDELSFGATASDDSKGRNGPVRGPLARQLGAGPSPRLAMTLPRTCGVPRIDAPSARILIATAAAALSRPWMRTLRLLRSSSASGFVPDASGRRC